MLILHSGISDLSMLESALYQRDAKKIYEINDDILLVRVYERGCINDFGISQTYQCQRDAEKIYEIGVDISVRGGISGFSISKGY